MIMLHNNLQGMEHRAPCKHIISPYTRTLNLWFGLKGKNSECGHVAYQIYGKAV